jgi:mono/diheme cytochrome c family protein
MNLETRLFSFIIFAALLAGAADTRKTVLDGVYSADQALRGQAAYTANCSSCHLDDLTAYRGALHGKAFLENFQEDNLESLFRITKSTMPRDSPASLPDDTYLDIIAYVLQVNSYPPGDETLRMDALKSVRIVGKAGPETLPNFALVSVIGCLTQGSGDTWTLTRTTEPIKTRNPDASSREALKADEAKPLGIRILRLVDVSYFQPASHKGHKMTAKGFLIRQPDGDQVNITSLQMLAASCTN